MNDRKRQDSKIEEEHIGFIIECAANKQVIKDEASCRAIATKILTEYNLHVSNVTVYQVMKKYLAALRIKPTFFLNSTQQKRFNFNKIVLAERWMRNDFY